MDGLHFEGLSPHRAESEKPGLKVNFVVGEPESLMAPILFKKASELRSVSHNLQSAAEKLLPGVIGYIRDSYLKGNIKLAIPPGETEQSWAEKFGNFLEQIIVTPQYQTFNKETKAHMEKLRSEWERNLAKTSSIITKAGLNPQVELTVNVCHPDYDGDIFDPVKKVLFYGHKEDKWDNYATVQIWRNILSQVRDGTPDLNRAVKNDELYKKLQIALNGNIAPEDDFSKNAGKKTRPNLSSMIGNIFRKIRLRKQMNLESQLMSA